MKNITLTPRCATICLLVSVALNLFLLTWLGVGWYKQKTRAPWMSLEAIEQRYAGRLGDSDAAAFRRALDAHKADLSAGIDANRNARAAVRQALQAEPFEPTRLESAFADSRRAMTNFQQAMHALLLDTAASLSSEGRHRLAEHPRRTGSGVPQPIHPASGDHDAASH